MTKENIFPIRSQLTSRPIKAGFAVKTGLHAGGLADMSETVFFALLNVLQKPTDWVYDRIVPLGSVKE
ncbi:MAG: hypothetical protein JW981_00900 [Anaerolineae bacterium]|nr:hypothetical protein [Anaerolineae bacterium]